MEEPFPNDMLLSTLHLNVFYFHRSLLKLPFTCLFIYPPMLKQAKISYPQKGGAGGGGAREVEETLVG